MIKSIDIKDSENLIIKVIPGLATTGKIDILYMAMDIEKDLATFNLEQGDYEVDITKNIIKGKDNFIGIYGKLFALPGKDKVEMTIKIYSNGEVVFSEPWTELYCKLMFKLTA